MLVLYLTSSASGTGKTGVAAGIGKRLRSLNKRIGYLRPVLRGERLGEDDDAAILQRFLGLQETHDLISPVFADQRSIAAGLKSAIAAVSSGKDVVIVESPANDGQAAADPAGSVEAKIVAVETYVGDFSSLAALYGAAAKRLAGVVVNKVPASRMARVSAEAGAQLGGARLLGAVPEDRLIMSMSVAELARGVGGKIVSGTQKGSSVIESVLLGAMNPDHGPEYYSVRANKAVIVRSERPDMQLAALETSTSCLVLAGEQPPIQMVLRRAEAKNVAIVSTKADVNSVVTSLESALKETRLNDRRIAALAELMEKHIDFSTLI